MSTEPVATSPRDIQLLVVDDDEGLLVLMGETLRAEGYEVGTARSARAARAWLERRTPDLMILDLKLPDADGPALVAELQRGREPVPFLVVTGQGDEKVAVEVMKQGALDYLMKDGALLDLLPTVVKRSLGVVEQGRQLAAAQAEHQRLEREILAAGERERQSIGADLHDGLGQQLTALEFMCTALKVDLADQPEIAQRLDDMGRMLREAVAQTRFLARGLVPVGEGPDALQNGLTELAHRANGLGRVRCTFDCPEPVPVSDAEAAGHLYRIAQEAVNNALKHGRARHVALRLAANGDGLVLEVADDGAGLPKDAAKRGGVGLGAIRYRADAIAADLTIASKRGEGVKITCRWPGRPAAGKPAAAPIPRAPL